VPVVLAVAALLIAPPALGVLGTFLADVPHIGLATAYVPWYLPWLTGRRVGHHRTQGP
jgi:acetyl esterase